MTVIFVMLTTETHVNKTLYRGRIVHNDTIRISSSTKPCSITGFHGGKVFYTRYQMASPGLLLNKNKDYDRSLEENRLLRLGK